MVERESGRDRIQVEQLPRADTANKGENEISVWPFTDEYERRRQFAQISAKQKAREQKSGRRLSKKDQQYFADERAKVNAQIAVAVEEGSLISWNDLQARPHKYEAHMNMLLEGGLITQEQIAQIRLSPADAQMAYDAGYDMEEAVEVRLPLTPVEQKADLENAEQVSTKFGIMPERFAAQLAREEERNKEAAEHKGLLKTIAKPLRVAFKRMFTRPTSKLGYFARIAGFTVSAVGHMINPAIAAAVSYGVLGLTLAAENVHKLLKRKEKFKRLANFMEEWLIGNTFGSFLGTPLAAVPGVSNGVKKVVEAIGVNLPENLPLDPGNIFDGLKNKIKPELLEEWGDGLRRFGDRIREGLPNVELPDLQIPNIELPGVLGQTQLQPERIR